MTDSFLFLAKGGFVMIPLLACSVVSLAVTIERYLFWRMITRKEPAERMLQSVEQGNVADALSQAKNATTPLMRVLAAGLEHREHACAKAMEVVAQGQIPLLKNRLVILDTIVTLAPLLGLLGTITGMISSFGIMSAAGLGQPHAVTGGIAEALIATATGLLIAILTLISYNYFNSRVEKELEIIEYFASRLELILLRQ
jgi:biopolymer transport protein ExbB